MGLRRPSVTGAFERPSLDAVKAPQVRMRTMSAVGRGLPNQLKAAVLSSSPKRASPPKPSAPPVSGPAGGVLPIPRRRSLMIKGSLAAPSTTSLVSPSGAAPVAVGTAKVTIRPKMSAPPRVTTDDERPVEVKERRTESPRRPPVTAINRTRERVDSRASPVRLGPGLAALATKGRSSPVRNESTPTATPKDDREKRKERREREKQAAEEKKEAIEREKKAALERERAKVAEAKKAEEQRTSSGHRTSGSTATLTSTSSIFTSISRSSTGDSHTSGGSTKAKVPKSKSNTAAFPRAAQTVVLTPPEDEEEDEDTMIQTPMTRSRTATGSTQFGDVSSPAISRTLLASISAQTESPIMAPLDQRLRRAGSFTSLISSLPSSTLPSPVHPGTVSFPPPAPGLATKFRGDTSDDEEDSQEEGDVSALLETVISPLKDHATPAMPRFSSKSKSSGRPHMPETPSRSGGLPGREALSYPSPVVPDSLQRTRVGKERVGHRGPRESILSYDALVERSRLEEDDLEDMLRAPPPAVGLISPDMRPSRGLPRLTSIGPKRMNLGGRSDSEAEIEEEPEDQTVHVSSGGGGQSISQVLFPIPGPSSPARSTKSRRELVEKEKLWTAKEEAWEKQRSEWEIERVQWEAERAQWTGQQAQWNAQRTLWNAQQSEWSGQQARWEADRSAWSAREQELKSVVQAREVDIEALEQENGAHQAESIQRSEEHRLEIEALLKRLEAFNQQSQELRAAKEREAKYDAHARYTSAINAWTGVRASLRSDAAACAADRAALRLILSGLETMVRCE
ncbi:unnamed protein product [Rhizoctonia solani]|uniref:Uncharacterized protein n=1 Tax=Rhizoctonia solani TaxID=456999 RepID=A0A8H3GL70_9AGAM|nr:unnamed protein product [Rhizoctonia solani]